MNSYAACLRAGQCYIGYIHGVLSSVTVRLVTILLLLELPFLALASGAFAWMLSLAGTSKLTPVVALIVVGYLIKTALWVPISVRHLAPCQRALAAGNAATEGQLVAGAEAARRLTLLAPVLIGIGWGVAFLVPTVVIHTMLGGLPHGNRALLSAVLFCAAITLGVPPASYGLTLMILRQPISDLSLAARMAGAPEPCLRGPALRTRFTAIFLCLSLGPVLWVMSMAYGPVVVELGMTGLVIGTVLFGLVAVLWALVTALSVSAAIGGSLAHTSHLVEEIAATGGATRSRVPVIEADELGRLAGAVNQMADRLAELDRAKRQFLSNAAHELKTPVAIVKGYAQLMRARDVSPGGARRSLDAIDRGINRIDRIISHLIDFARFQLGGITLRPEPFDIGHRIDDLIKGERVSSEHSVRMIGAIPSTLVNADPGRIDLIVRDLIDNAVERSSNSEPIEVSVEADADQVTVSITDHGIEIPTRGQAYLFDPLEPASDMEGLGVRLYNSRAVIRQSGGELGFSSARGHGSTFWFRLPRIPSGIQQG